MLARSTRRSSARRRDRRTSGVDPGRRVCLGCRLDLTWRQILRRGTGRGRRRVTSGSPLFRIGRALPRRAARAGWATCCPTLPDKPAPDDWPARRDYDTGWQRRLFDAGYAGISWPTEYGGRGATLVEQLIFLEETTRAGRALRRRQLRGHAARRADDHGRGQRPSRRPSTCPRILRGEEVWCQGFSEAGRGQRPGVAVVPGRARRRRVRGHRREDLDELRPGRRLVRAADPHRSRGARSTRASRG